MTSFYNEELSDEPIKKTDCTNSAKIAIQVEVVEPNNKMEEPLLRSMTPPNSNHINHPDV